MESNNDEIDGNNEEMDINKSGKDKKRKTSGDDSSIAPIPTTDLQQSDDDGGGGVDNNGFLTLTLASFTNDPTTLYPIPTPPPPPNMPLLNPSRRVTEPPDIAFTFVGAQRRMRRNPGKTPPPGKSATIPPPFPWSDTGRAAVRSLNYLRTNRISRISGDVQCKKCEQRFKMEFDLERRFKEVTKFIAENKNLMHHRAPKAWMSPALPKCSYCNQENSVRPVIAEKKRAINWLFLLLGQMMGCCTLDQLKYFCKHTKNHRTGAKDRVLFLAYLGLCRQLDPSGPFEL